MRLQTTILAIVTMTLFAAAAAAAEVDPDMQVVIRTYNAARLPEGDVEAAVGTATAILKSSDLESTWRGCEDAFVRNAAHPCAAPLGVNEIAVRIVRMTTDADYRGELSLGYSLVDTATHSGKLATIYLDRVAWLANAAGVDRTTLLGRAIAHELGHLLLGTNAHSDSGLMRALWSCADLQRNDGNDWTFAAADTQALRQAVHLRAAMRMARVHVGE
jgi:hypothetical protein